LSVAKKAVESTARRILVYTAEIIMSIILLVIICLPLAFTIPVWLQTIGLGAPRSAAFLDPVAMFGPEGAFGVTVLLTIASVLLGYIYVYRLIPGSDSKEEEEVEAEPEEEIEEVDEEEESEEEIEEEEPE
jgi:hypothetical protein